jgi:hypothetical protein
MPFCGNIILFPTRIRFIAARIDGRRFYQEFASALIFSCLNDCFRSNNRRVADFLRHIPPGFDIYIARVVSIYSRRPALFYSV